MGIVVLLVFIGCGAPDRDVASSTEAPSDESVASVSSGPIPLDAVPADARPTITLSADDLAMADQVVAANTRSLPGFLPGSTVQSGPGPLNEVDRLVLMALKLHREFDALVPYPGFVKGLEQLAPSQWNCVAAERFWAWYREMNVSSEPRWTLREGFESYIQMKLTEKLRVQNRQLEANVAGEVAWRRAMEADRQFRENIAAGEAQARQARAAYMEQWTNDYKQAMLAELEWKLYITFGAGHMDEPKR